MIAIVSAGLGRPSSCRLLGERLAAATATGAEAVSIEVRDHARDLTEALLTGFVSPSLRQALDAVRRADALIAVTPVYKASYSGLFKVFFDVLDDAALADVPVLIAAVGGTARHSLVLEHAVRPLFTYLRATVVPTAVFTTVPESADPDAALRERIDRAGRDLVRLMGAADDRLLTVDR